MNKVLWVFLSFILVGTCSLIAQGPPPPPLSQKEVVDLLKSKQQRAQAPTILGERGVDFELTPEIEKQLRKAKADDQIITIVKNAGPAARAARAAAQGGANFTPEEGRDLQAIENELDPDRAIQLTNEFEQKHPNSSGLTYAYAFAANKYQEKGEFDKVIAYGEKSLKLKSDNLLSLLIMSSMLPQPQSMRSGDPEKKLAQAEAYANQALQLIDQLPKQPNETDDQWKSKKAQLSREPHAALGMVHLQRAQQALEGLDQSELEKAEQEYQTAVTITTQPNAQDYYRLGEVRVMLKKYDLATEAFTKASELGQGTVVKTYADERIQALQKLKAQTPAKQ